MPLNTLAFVAETIQSFKAANFSLHLFGGWAEELWQISLPRSHHDIDFLYPADSFQHLDQHIAETSDVQEIESKRFSHKRAMIYKDVIIEFLIVKQGDSTCYTDFFSGQYRFEWPHDLLCHKRDVSGYDLPIASKQALGLYRQRHKYIEEAYEAFTQSSTSVSP